MNIKPRTKREKTIAFQAAKEEREFFHKELLELRAKHNQELKLAHSAKEERDARIKLISSCGQSMEAIAKALSAGLNY